MTESQVLETSELIVKSMSSKDVEERIYTFIKFHGPISFLEILDHFMCKESGRKAVWEAISNLWKEEKIRLGG